jgi:hypothetical protein
VIYNLKALVVVLGIACAVFWLAAPLMRRFMAPADLRRRVGLWFVLTVAGFASPNFWFFLIVAAPLLVWAGQRDPNAAALTLVLLHVIPTIDVEVPTLIVNRLFELTHYRVLALLVLLPAAWRLAAATSGQPKPAALRAADTCVLAFCALQLVLLAPYESFTNTMRRGFLYGLDVGLVYYVFSRGLRDARRFDEAIAALCLGVAVMAPIAVFESLRQWLLYPGIAARWGAPNEFSWLMRGESLRAQAAAGHALVLGYLCAMALALWAFLQQRIPEAATLKALAFVTLVGGLLAAISRGPWLVAVLAYFAFYLLGPSPGSALLKRLGIAGVVGALLLISPWGASLIDRLPFVGTVDVQNVEYRQRLADVSWLLIQRHPWFCDPFVLYQMEELRQGQGIIDLVNGYAATALFFGGVGLVLQLGAFAIGLVLAIVDALRLPRRDAGRAARSAVLAACMTGTLLMLAFGGFGGGLAIMFWIFGGLGMANAIGNRQVPVRAARVPAHHARPLPARPTSWARGS